MKNSFKDLKVWQKGLDLVDKVFDLCEKLPPKLNKALYSQLTSCSVSIPSNIAEGQRRFSRKEFIHHLKYALGSTAELETQLIICFRRNYINESELNEACGLIGEINSGLVSLINYLENKGRPNLKP